MAKNNSTVYLGYDDEEITIKHASTLNSTLNKIGGTADWPNGEIKVPVCPLCGTARTLIVQLYAPLEQSQFHRTLYIFACLNPACSQNSKSWLCIRTQHLETPSQEELLNAATKNVSGGKKNKKAKPAPQKIVWCSGADDWGPSGEVEDMDTEADDFQQQTEENGNVIEKNDNSPLRQISGHLIGLSGIGLDEPDDDDDDESNSIENDLICGFGQLDVNTPQNGAEDPNANCASGVGAVALVGDVPLGGISYIGGATATFCAEIECAETDVVLVETPKKPERDLIALLKHTPAIAALGPLAKITDITLKPHFVAVDIESQWQTESENYDGALSADHILDLYMDYKQRNEEELSPNGGADSSGSVGGDEKESYENTLPPHGDVLFHKFVSTLQQNPGQILRYSRDTLPLLIAPLPEPIPKCQNCNGETICEIQVLSTLIPKLKLQQNGDAAPIEYGNVLVFTCLKSCWDTPDKMRYERVIVQAEH